MIMLCFIGGILTPEKENELKQYDTPDVQIHLFDDVLSEISLGKVLAVAENIQSDSPEDMIFYTDMEKLYLYVNAFLKNRFTKILLAGKVCKCPYAVSEYESLIGLEGKPDDMSAVIGDTQALKHFMTKTERTRPIREADYYNEVNTRFGCIYKEIQHMSKEGRAFYYRFLEEYAEIVQEEEWEFRIFALSVLLSEKKETIYLEMICNEAQQASCSSVDNMFYLYQQLKRVCFEKEINDSGAEKLFDHVLAVWKEATADILQPIPKTERDPKKIIVIARQFLGMRHAPTRTALERIEFLAKLREEVLCFHAKEYLTGKGMMPFSPPQYGNVNESLNGLNRMDLDGFSFYLYQPECQMPDYAEVRSILETIREQKPYEIVVIGDHCLLGDLCAEMIPTICIPVGFTTLAFRKNQFIAIGRPLTEQDERRIEEQGCKREQYIESVFTFQLLAQRTMLSREALKLPKDAFIVSVVGIRLHNEVSRDFIRAMEPLLTEGVHIAFAGQMDSYEELCEEFDLLKEHSTYVGYQEDILAFQEVCDLYVNPPRIGGGFSAVEAFYKRKPGVSLPYGDVATVMGSDFCVDSLQEMVEKIRYYKEHSDYYHEMAEKAYQRALVLLDGKAAMEHILSEAERREGFF